MFYSSSTHKRSCWESFGFKTSDLETLEIQGTPQEIVLQKCQNLPNGSIVEDVSLYIDCLNGMPGPFIKYFVETLPGCVENSRAKAECLVCYKDNYGDCYIFSGKIHGRMKLGKKSGFGFDSVFLTRKNKFLSESKETHRTRAIQKLKTHLNFEKVRKELETKNK